MLRRLVIGFVMLCTGWQSLAHAGFAALTAHEDQQRHELLHFEGIAHHHDAHGEGIHEDDSVASVLHVLADASQFAPVLPCAPALWPAVAAADRALTEHRPERPWLLPRGLDRPPKPLA